MRLVAFIFALVTSLPPRSLVASLIGCRGLLSTSLALTGGKYRESMGESRREQDTTARTEREGNSQLIGDSQWTC